MTDEQKAALEAAIRHFDFHKHVYADHMRALLAAGASEGQAEPIYQVKRVHGWVDVPESRYTEIKEDPNDCGELRILYLHPSAEITALRERIAGMEKDAEIGHALIANGLYDRMNDMVDEDGPAKLIEELIAVVDPILDAKFKLKFAAMKEPKL